MPHLLDCPIPTNSQKIYVAIVGLILVTVDTIIVAEPKIEPDGCPSLWKWSIACTVFSWTTFLLLLCGIVSGDKAYEDLRKRGNGILCCSFSFTVSMKIPMFGRGILGLVNLKESCRTEYSDNVLLLYGSIVIFIYYIVSTLWGLIFDYMPHQRKVARMEREEQGPGEHPNGGVGASQASRVHDEIHVVSHIPPPLEDEPGMEGRE
jgi:hypothetical protein